jgi:hypothetical protein
MHEGVFRVPLQYAFIVLLGYIDRDDDGHLDHLRQVFFPDIETVD